MVSIGFIYFFLPIFMGLYLLLPPKHRGVLISAGSAALITYVSPWGLIPFCVSVLAAYFGGLLTDKFRGSKSLRGFFLWTSVLLNIVGFLLFSRSVITGREAGLIPVDIPFVSAVSAYGVGVYTLRSILYCVEVSRGTCRCERSFSVLCRYIAFFPTLVIGPIMGLDRIRGQLKTPRLSTDKAAEGIFRLMRGLLRKLFFSNALYGMWCDVKGVSVSSLPAMAAWLGIVAFGLFIYFEISAYSDIAIGLGALMGISLRENVREPFKARSFHEFFFRLNTSLYRFLRRCIHRGVMAVSRRHHARLISMILCIAAGTLWYTRSLRSYIFFLLLFLIFLGESTFGAKLKMLPKPVSRSIMLFLLAVILPFIAFSDPTDAVYYVGALFGLNTVAADMISEYLVSSYGLFLLPAILSAAGLFRALRKKLEQSSEFIMTILRPLSVILLLIVCTAFLVSVDREMLVCLI